MSLQFDDAADYIERTSALPNSQAWSFLLWLKLTASSSNDRTLFYIQPSGGGQWVAMQINPGTVIVEISITGSIVTGSAALSQDLWYCAGGMVSNTDSDLFIWNSAGSLVDSVHNAAAPSFTPAVMMSCGTNFGTQLEGRGSYLRVWDATLSLAELEAERFSTSIVRAANINSAITMIGGSVTDYSGNGRDWTNSGGNAVSNGDDPVLTPPAAPRLYTPVRSVIRWQ